jgi:hypothetical protein
MNITSAQLKSALARPAQSPRRPRRPGTSGRTLETLALASSGRGAVPTKVPNGVKYLPGGKTVPIPSPVDISGTLAGGRHLVFDCKECGRADGFAVNADHVRPHQIMELCRHGEQGAAAGLLILRTATDGLYWLDYSRLAASQGHVVKWDAMPLVGTAKVAIDWANVAAGGRASE